MTNPPPSLSHLATWKNTHEEHEPDAGQRRASLCHPAHEDRFQPGYVQLALGLSHSVSALGLLLSSKPLLFNCMATVYLLKSGSGLSQPTPSHRSQHPHHKSLLRQQRHKRPEHPSFKLTIDSMVTAFTSAYWGEIISHSHATSNTAGHSIVRATPLTERVREKKREGVSEKCVYEKEREEVRARERENNTMPLSCPCTHAGFSLGAESPGYEPRYQELARVVSAEFTEADVSGFVGRQGNVIYRTPTIMDAIQKAHDGKPVEKITKSRPPCVIL
ncbi:hypothetical protein JZ751_026415 [Albula glossodonta]|uniref:Uncharacterized protein n=1 Tax=Albula glossodonta TaxID=121402 RepID=A0A8T2PK69_9TELE|nr:hypothetical protein JZ751_026415 [Albula glossodonta]